MIGPVLMESGPSLRESQEAPLNGSQPTQMQGCEKLCMSVVVSSCSVVPSLYDPMYGTHQACLSFTISQSLLKLMFIESVMPSNHLILCHPPSPALNLSQHQVFSNESPLCIRWPKYWSFSFSINPSNEYSGSIPLGLTGLISWQSEGLLRVFSNTTVGKHQFFDAQPSLGSNSLIHT